MRGDSAGSQAADLTSHFAFASDPQFPIFNGRGHITEGLSWCFKHRENSLQVK